MITPVSPSYLDQLPKPVAKYLRLNVKERQPIIHTARITQSGILRAGWWTPFVAKQYFCTNPPAFVWAAAVRVAHIVPVKVRDAYRAGKGSMLGKVFGIVPFISQQNSREINEAALQRFLAETPWFPTALLPGQKVTWTGIDMNRAIATLIDRGNEASLEFEFNEIGEIIRVFAKNRYRFVDGKFVSTPWAGYFNNYKTIDGVRIPMHVEVEWILPDGRFPYFKGNIIEIEYNVNVPSLLTTGRR